jgi:hypothetical protein
MPEADGTQGILPPGPKPLISEEWQGINTATTRTGVDEKMLAWCEGFFPLEPGNLRCLPDRTPTPIFTTSSAAIVFMATGNIKATPYIFVFLADGSIQVVNINTPGPAPALAGPGTIQNPSPQTVGLSQWGSQYILIVSKQTNGYWIWDGTTLYSAGTLAPGTVLTNQGAGYTSAPTVTASGGTGSGATFTAQTTPTGAISAVSVNNPNNLYNATGPTLQLTGGSGSGAQLQANSSWVWGPGGAQFTTIHSVTVLNGGTGYSSASPPVVSVSNLTPVSLGQATTFTVTISATGTISGVTMTNPGSGYSAGDVVTLNFSGGGGTGAAATVSIMPFGESGTSVETYSGRVWITNGPNVSFTAPNSVTDFAQTDGGGSFQSSDSFLRVGYTRPIQANGFLYLVGDSSINYISNVTASVTPPSVSVNTTFTNQNADPETGSPWAPTIGTWGQNIIFANIWGVHIIYGSRAQKVSEALDGVYNTVGSNPVLGFPGNFIPSSGKLNVFGKKVWCLLLPVVDPISKGTVNKLFLWNGKIWFTAQQGLNLIYIASSEINSTFLLWGTDGINIYQLFTTPSNFVGKVLRTKFWSASAAYMLLKSAVRFWMLMVPNTSEAPSFTLTIDNETNSASYVLGTTAPQVIVINAGGTTVQVINTFGQGVIVTAALGQTAVSQPLAVAQTGTLLGYTISTTAADVSIISTALQPEIVGYRG